MADRQTHHLSLICCRIGSGEVMKKEGGTNERSEDELRFDYGAGREGGREESR